MGNWTKYKLSELGEIVGGATPSTSRDDFYGGDIPWLTPKDLSSFNGRYIDGGERNITKEGYESCSAKMLPKGSVLFTSRAPIGYVAIAANDICTNQGFKSIIPNEKKINNVFLYYLLVFNKNNIESLGSGTTFKEVSGATMKNIEVLCPPLDKQKRIADVLSSLDDKIELHNRINANFEAQAQAIFKSWFVDFEPFRDGEFIESELGMIPKGWNTAKLGEITNIIAGGDKPIIFSEQLNERCAIPIYSNGISDDGLYGYTDVCRIEKESITISARGTIGFICLRQKPFVPIVRLISITPVDKRISCKYLYFWSKHQNIVGTGTTQQQLTVPDVSKMVIGVPPVDAMSRFTNIADAMYKEIFQNNDINQALSSIRDTLLPKLMSSELSVEGAEQQL